MLFFWPSTNLPVSAERLADLYSTSKCFTELLNLSAQIDIFNDLGCNRFSLLVNSTFSSVRAAKNMYRRQPRDSMPLIPSHIIVRWNSNPLWTPKRSCCCSAWSKACHIILLMLIIQIQAWLNNTSVRIKCTLSWSLLHSEPWQGDRAYIRKGLFWDCTLSKFYLGF